MELSIFDLLIRRVVWALHHTIFRARCNEDSFSTLVATPIEIKTLGSGAAAGIEPGRGHRAS